MMSFEPLRRLITCTSLAIAVSHCGSVPFEQSETKVSNGIISPEYLFPAVVMLSTFQPDGAQSICTGTYVNHYQIVTAAHCLEYVDPRNPELYIMNTPSDGVPRYSIRTKAIAAIQHPYFQFEGGTHPNDIGVVFVHPYSSEYSAPVAERAPSIGDDIVIAGYGNSATYTDRIGNQTGHGSGILRMGRNVLLARQNGYLLFVGAAQGYTNMTPGHFSAAGSGDSGGPLFFHGHLAGVTSGGGLLPPYGQANQNYYVDLNAPANRAFLDQVLNRIL